MSNRDVDTLSPYQLITTCSRAHWLIFHLQQQGSLALGATRKREDERPRDTLKHIYSSTTICNQYQSDDVNFLLVTRVIIQLSGSIALSLMLAGGRMRKVRREQ